MWNNGSRYLQFCLFYENIVYDGYQYKLAVSNYLKHTTTLFSLFDHYILSREWRVIVDQEQAINYHVSSMVL